MAPRRAPSWPPKSRKKPGRRNGLQEFWRVNKPWYEHNLKYQDNVGYRYRPDPARADNDVYASLYKAAMFDWKQMSRATKDTYVLSGKARALRDKLTMFDPAHDLVADNKTRHLNMNIVHGNFFEHGQCLPGTHDIPALGQVTTDRNGRHWTFDRLAHRFHHQRNVQVWDRTDGTTSMVVKSQVFNPAVWADSLHNAWAPNKDKFLYEALILAHLSPHRTVIRYKGIERDDATHIVRFGMEEAIHGDLANLVDLHNLLPRDAYVPRLLHLLQPIMRRFVAEYPAAPLPDHYVAYINIDRTNWTLYYDDCVRLIRRILLLGPRLGLDSFEELTYVVHLHAFPEDLIWHILATFADAADRLRARNIVHPDLKPANIFLCEADPNNTTMGGWCIQPKLGDFGGAVYTTDTRKYAEKVGTEGFRCPEAYENPRVPEHVVYVQNRGGYEPASNIWSLGAITWALLDPLFSGDNPTVWLPNGQWATLDPMHYQDSSLLALPIPDLYSRPLVDLVKRCLEPDPRNRATTQDIRQQVNQYLANRPANVVPTDGGFAFFYS